MRKISEAIKENTKHNHLKCYICNEEFINDSCIAGGISCPNGCKTVLAVIETEDNLKEKIKKLEKDLNKAYDERNDLIDLCQAKVCKGCKRFGVLYGYVCFFCRKDPTVS